MTPTPEQIAEVNRLIASGQHAEARFVLVDAGMFTSEAILWLRDHVFTKLPREDQP